MTLKDLMTTLKECSALTAKVVGIDGTQEHTPMQCEITMGADGKIESVKVILAVGGRD